MTQILYELSDKLYLKDPQKSATGQLLLQKAIALIDEMGFEHFTIRKLAEEAGCTEPTVYRYFENKHKLLLYLVDWYWAITSFNINFATNNIPSPEARLKISVQFLIGSQPWSLLEQIDQAALHRIIVAEHDKIIMSKSVSHENPNVLFSSYTDVCKKIASIIYEINPNYPFPHALVSAALQAANQQIHHSRYFPDLCDLTRRDGALNDNLTLFLESLLQGAIKSHPTL